MNENWQNAVVSKIVLSTYVPPNTGKHIHNNRPSHGLVLNDEGSEKDYIFSDGTVLHTKGNEVFYLPKGSSYRVKSITATGCHCINFDCTEPISDEPFIVKFRDSDAVLKCFKEAYSAWLQHQPFYKTKTMKLLYNIIELTAKETEKQYMPSAHERILSPAIEEIYKNFTQNELTVSHLAQLCDVSEAYFRRLFLNKFGISPKQYITKLRISHAKRLIKSGQFAISEVATLCGYSEPCHFSREFTRIVGVSPNKYRNEKTKNI